MSGEKGFSLLETMCAATMFCFVSTISFPCILNLKSGMILRSVAEQMAADLQAAKIEAVKNNAFTVVQFKENGYRIFLDDGAAGAGIKGDWICQDEEQVLGDRELDPLIKLQSNFPDQALRFKGIAGIRPGTITLIGKNGTSYKIILSRAGRLRVAKARS